VKEQGQTVSTWTSQVMNLIALRICT